MRPSLFDGKGDVEKESLWERNKVLLIALATVAAVVVFTLLYKRPVGPGKPYTGLALILSGLRDGCIYALVAMGFSVIYASTNVINFAQGDFSMLGGMLLYTFCTNKADAMLAGPMPVIAGFMLSLLIVTLVGAACERVAIRPARKASVITLIIITIGLSIFIRAIVKWIWTSESKNVAGFTGEVTYRFLDATLTRQDFWIFGLTALAVLLVYLFFNYTLLGKGMRAAASNRDAASLMGVSPSTSSLVSWMIASALGAVAGMAIAPIRAIDYGYGVMLGLKGFSAAVLGGLGNMIGAVIGGLTLGVLESIISHFASGYQNAVAFLILILVLLVRPQGLMGRSGEAEA